MKEGHCGGNTWNKAGVDDPMPFSPRGGTLHSFAGQT